MKLFIVFWLTTFCLGALGLSCKKCAGECAAATAPTYETCPEGEYLCMVKATKGTGHYHRGCVEKADGNVPTPGGCSTTTTKGKVEGVGDASTSTCFCKQDGCNTGDVFFPIVTTEHPKPPTTSTTPSPGSGSAKTEPISPVASCVVTSVAYLLMSSLLP